MSFEYERWILGLWRKKIDPRFWTQSHLEVLCCWRTWGALRAASPAMTAVYCWPGPWTIDRHQGSQGEPKVLGGLLFTLLSFIYIDVTLWWMLMSVFFQAKGWMMPIRWPRPFCVWCREPWAFSDLHGMKIEFMMERLTLDRLLQNCSSINISPLALGTTESGGYRQFCIHFLKGSERSDHSSFGWAW